MTTIPARLCRALAMAAFLLLAVQAPNAAEDAAAPDADLAQALEDAPAPDADLAQAQALFDEGRFDEALAVLRPLTTERRVHADVVFLLGLAAIEASRKSGLDDAAREALLDEAIAALHEMLVERPDLVRVRLELARAFFYKGEDGLARDHFERVLAGDVPPAVANNVRTFLLRIRARRRWTAYLGASVSPDSNIGSTSDDEIIYILGLPFRRDNPEELTTSGVGVAIWTGGEYEHPLGPRRRLRAGADLTRREYAGSEFDETSLSLHLGPRLLIDGRTQASVLATARRRWYADAIDYDAAGARVEARRRLAARVSANVRGSWEHRNHRERDSQDGHVADVSLGATWTITPILRVNASMGYGRERPDSESYRNRSLRVRAGLSAILPRGFNASASAQFRETDYEGNWSLYTGSPDVPREDRTRTLSLSVHKRDFTLYGFAPELAVVHEERESNVGIHNYNRTRGELRFVRQF